MSLRNFCAQQQNSVRMVDPLQEAIEAFKLQGVDLSGVRKTLPGVEPSHLRPRAS